MHDNPKRGNQPVRDFCAECVEPASELSVKAERTAALRHRSERKGVQPLSAKVW